MIAPSGKRFRQSSPGETEPVPERNRVMNALTKWNPFREMEQLTEWSPSARGAPFRELERMRDRMERLFGRWPAGLEKEEALVLSEWAPRVDVVETQKEFLIKAELPEVTKEEVKVTVENGVLSMSGERKLEKEEKGKKYHRVERAYGRFERSFTLPEGTEPGKITSEFKEGVLTVHVPKNPEASPKAVKVTVA
jgi:HSP20 family protein